LMSRDLITIPRRMTLHGAAHRLALAHVSGAPVVDDDGHCIGVLSSTDLVRWVDTCQPLHSGGVCQEGQYHSPWQIPVPEVLDDDEVSRHMTTDIVTARSQMPIGDLAQRMLDAQIHRVIIVDAQDRAVGVVTGTDILAAVADAHRAKTMDCRHR